MHLFSYDDGFPPNRNSKHHQHVRVVVMGAERVGKTALIKQALYRHFPEIHERTVEDSFFYRGHHFDLEIIDTSGSYNFPEMTKLAIMAGDLFVLVFSVEDWSTFDRVGALRKQIIDLRGSDVPVLVVGNRADSFEREVPMEMADSVVSIEWGCKYHDVTATDHKSSVQIFNDVLKFFPKLYGETITPAHEFIRLPTRRQKRRNSKLRRSVSFIMQSVKERLAL